MVMISLVHFFGGDNSCISDDHSPKENDDYHSFEWHCNHLIQYDGNGHPFALNVKKPCDEMVILTNMNEMMMITHVQKMVMITLM